MINDFIYSLAAAIKEFAPNATIYSEKIPQNFKTPCFYIHCINHNQQLLTGGKRKMTMIEIVFFPTENGGNANTEMILAAEQLVEYMSIVEHDGKEYKGIGASTSFSDEELHYIANYNYNTLRSSDAEKMQTLKVEQKGG